jgi:hypothetical protein
MSTGITIPAGAAIPASITVPASTTNNQHHASRLHLRYVRFDFKNDSTDLQDARREGLFKRLVMHHLLAHSFPASADWNDKAAQDKCIRDFLGSYAERLWPGTKADRGHFVHAPIKNVARAKRSWIGGYDGWGSHPSTTLGVLVREYVDVLLESGLMGAVAEDPDALIAGILSVVVGPPILAPVVVLKAEDASDGDNVAIKVEDWLSTIEQFDT